MPFTSARLICWEALKLYRQTREDTWLAPVVRGDGYRSEILKVTVVNIGLGEVKLHETRDKCPYVCLKYRKSKHENKTRVYFPSRAFRTQSPRGLFWRSLSVYCSRFHPLSESLARPIVPCGLTLLPYRTLIKQVTLSYCL